MSIIKTWWVRHAAVNNSGRLYGVLDFPCLPIGRDEVCHLREGLPSPKTARYFTSGLVRTHQTLKSVNNEAWQESQAIEELNEQNLGSLEGVLFSELAKGKNIEWNNLLADFSQYRPARGESFDEVVARVGIFIDNMISHTEHENIVLFVHAGVIRAAIVHCLGLPCRVAMSFEVSHLSLTVLEHNRLKTVQDQDNPPRLWDTRIYCSNWHGKIDRCRG